MRATSARIVLLAGIASALVACAQPPTQEQRIANFASKCASYGYEPGTPGMRSCVREEEAGYQARGLALMGMMDFPEVQQPPPMIPIQGGVVVVQ